MKNTMNMCINGQIKIKACLSLALICITLYAGAEDLRRIVSLTGYWKFSVGDNTMWSAPDYNDHDWDEIKVPGRWEDSGYSDYNGYAWYRRKFTIQRVDNNTPLFLVFGRIDDTDEVFLNGNRIGKTGSFPPEYRSAYNVKRKYPIPKEYLNVNGSNVIAVRVYDSYLEGGIIEGPVGIFADEDYALLDLDLSGLWKFQPGDNMQWKTPSYNDDLWTKIQVPAPWEQEGYDEYDGYAWYRKKFGLPARLKNKTLYLILGKIDDYDDVYLNGVPVGTVFDLKKDSEYKRKGYEYNARRIYKIPPNVLNENGNNTIAVRVYDLGLRGGIYEGPIGLMTEDNCRRYKNKHYRNQSFWDFLIEGFFTQ